jgi:hypothetical protein
MMQVPFLDVGHFVPRLARSSMHRTRHEAAGTSPGRELEAFGAARQYCGSEHCVRYERARLIIALRAWASAQNTDPRSSQTFIATWLAVGIGATPVPVIRRRAHDGRRPGEARSGSHEVPFRSISSVLQPTTASGEN